MIDWKNIDTVLLDMDGTLLDLNFDNHFWKEFVPLKFSEKQGVTVADAKRQLQPQFKNMEGRLEWYCLDYWSNILELDIAGLKAELAGLIEVLPHVVDFLEKLKTSRQRAWLVTNAHRGSLALKMEKTCLHEFFERIVSSHDLGIPKERPEFWGLLQQQQAFDRRRTLLVDDNTSVLQSAKTFGIAHLVSVSRPDSRQPKKTIIDFRAIEDFRKLMNGL